ncbi:septum formation family protein, partial [Streptomyces fulvoviolaceus]
LASAPPGPGAGPPVGWGGPAAPGTPQTPGAPPTPDTPQTPHTPAGGPGHPGSPATPGAAGPDGSGFGSGSPATPGATPYNAWPQPAQQSPDPGNPYAQGPGSPYAGGGAQFPSVSSESPSPYSSGGPQAPYASAQPPYGGSGAPSPYSSGGTAQPYSGGQPGGYGSPGGPTPPGGPFGPGGQVPPPPPPPRTAARKRLALVALVVGVMLVIAGGAWAAVSLTGDDGKKDTATKSSPSPSASGSSPSPTGPVLPYGDVVGLEAPLETGDCVQAVWSGTPFKSAPNLGVVDCADDWPDGQVVAVDTATDFADARAEGAKRCANLSRAVVDALPDAAGYAVVPTKEGFSTADSGTACLVLGRHAAIGGEVGRFRDTGTDLWVGQMSVGDCWVYEEQEEGYKAALTDCAKTHTDQVIGTVQAPAEMTYKKGTDNASKLCSNKFESTWAPGRERLVYGWVADEDDWDRGFTKVVCTVSLTGDKTSTGKIPPPGAV